jgi:hypothetical protein
MSSVKPKITANNLITLLNAHVQGGVDVYTPGSSGVFMRNLGLIDSTGNITLKGQAHVAQLLQLDLPVSKEVWVDGQGNTITF